MDTSCSVAEMKVLKFFIGKAGIWYLSPRALQWRADMRTKVVSGTCHTGSVVVALVLPRLEGKGETEPHYHHFNWKHHLWSLLSRIIKSHHEFSWLSVMTALLQWGSWARMDRAMGCKPTWGAGQAVTGFCKLKQEKGSVEFDPKIGEDNLDWFFRAFNSTRIYEVFLKRALDFTCGIDFCMNETKSGDLWKAVGCK